MDAQHLCSSHLDHPDHHSCKFRAIQWSPRMAIFSDGSTWDISRIIEGKWGGCLRIGGTSIYNLKINSKYLNKCTLLPTHNEGESIAGRICFSCSGQKPKEQGLPLKTKSRWLVLAWLLWWLVIRQKLTPTFVALPSSTRGSTLHARPRDTKRKGHAF